VLASDIQIDPGGFYSTRQGEHQIRVGLMEAYAGCFIEDDSHVVGASPAMTDGD
jgi:hypothetical protein